MSRQIIWIAMIALSAAGALAGDLVLRGKHLLIGTLIFAANGIVVYWIFEVRKDLVSLVAVWLGIYLILSAGVGWLVLGEGMGMRKAAGIICALAAIWLCE